MGYKAMENIKTQLELEFLKSCSYEQINDMMNQFKTKLDNLQVEKEGLLIQKSCISCKHFQPSEVKGMGACLHLDVLLEDEDKGIRLFNVQEPNGLLLVGKNYGCIHHEKK